MVDARIYRTALLPALLALVVVMFSLRERPAPLTPALAPEAFSGQDTDKTVRELIDRTPDRRPGGDDDAEVAELVQGRFESLGFEVSRDRFEAPVRGEEVSMTNVWGVLRGRSDRQVVLLAHRDSGRSPGAASASSTAVLLEFATVLEGLRHRKTFVFVSTDGGVAGGAGARRFAQQYTEKEKVEAALILDDIAATSPRRPYLVPWSTNARRGSLQFLRTADAAVRREAGSAAGTESWFGQFMRQAWPLTLREQGPLVREGLDALTLTSRGGPPRGPSGDVLGRISRPRLLEFGKAALATALAVDSSTGIESSPRRFVVAGRQVIPGWAVSLLALALLLPVFATSVDGFARARRRRLPVGLWVRWVVMAAVPFLVVLAGAWAFKLAGWLPESVSEALAPASRPTFREAAPPLGVLILAFALAWLVVRPALTGSPGRPRCPDSSVAPTALALVVSSEALLVWAVNPFTALLLAPVAHLCLLAAFSHDRTQRMLRAGMVLSALMLPVLALAYYGARLDIGGDVTGYLLMLVTGGSGSVRTALIGSLVAGGLLSTGIVALSRHSPAGSP